MQEIKKMYSGPAYMILKVFRDGEAFFVTSGRNNTPFATNEISVARGELTRLIKRTHGSYFYQLIQVDPAKSEILVIEEREATDYSEPVAAKV